MASNNSLSSRLEELRSRNPQSPPSESTYSGYNTPTRYSGSFMQSHSQSTSTEARGSLQRRFTTDSGNLPTLTPIGQQPSQVMESVDMSAT
ncbi:mRNA binding protein puf3, partial [Trapelia coarctata]|nr:mRNA binding protein puf3 [Trapelia coarctata]